MVHIYKLFCKDENIKDCYIGSTKNIKIRINNHKQSCNNENINSHNQYKYIFIRENGGWENWCYDIICECTSEDRYKIERWYVENTANTNLNKCIPNRGGKEYRELNKEHYKEYYESNKKMITKKNKEYRELHKEMIKEQKNEKHNCECGGKYTNANKNQHLKTKIHQTFISSKAICD